MSFSI